MPASSDCCSLFWEICQKRKSRNAKRITKRCPKKEILTSFWFVFLVVYLCVCFVLVWLGLVWFCALKCFSSLCQPSPMPLYGPFSGGSESCDLILPSVEVQDFMGQLPQRLLAFVVHLGSSMFQRLLKAETFRNGTLREDYSFMLWCKVKLTEADYNWWRIANSCQHQAANQRLKAPDETPCNSIDHFSSPQLNPPTAWHEGCRKTSAAQWRRHAELVSPTHLGLTCGFRPADSCDFSRFR